MKVISCCVAMLTGAISIAQAEIYQWTDAAGATHYSDQAPRDQPNLQSKSIVIPTAIPATKPRQKAAERTEPIAIMIDGPNRDTHCISQQINSANHPNQILDAWQDSEWKRCRGMK